MTGFGFRLVYPQRGWADVLVPQECRVPSSGLDKLRAQLEPISGIRISDDRISLPENTWDLQVVRDAVAELTDGGVPVPRTPLGIVAAPRDDLLDHQQVAVQRALDREALLLGDVMGLGKTRTSLVAADLYARAQGDDAIRLIIAPRFVREVFRSECEKLDLLRHEGDFVALETRRADRTIPDDARWVFVHYDIIRAWWFRIWRRRPVAVIVDEAHWIRNGRTQRGRGTSVAAAAIPFRMLLTGTPLLNRPSELWHLLSVTTGPHSWGGPLAFRQRYNGAIHDGYGYRDQSPTNTEELRRRMFGCYLRRTVRDCGLSLPPLTRRRLTAALNDGDRELHETLLEQIRAGELLEILLTGRGSRETLRVLGKLRKLTSQIKLPVTQQYVVDAVEAEESVVVFVWERRTAVRLARALDRATSQIRGTMLAPIAVHGGLSQEERAGIVEDFQAHGGVLVATLDCLGVGVTLHRARLVVLHDLDWTPATVLQAEARVFRIGQVHPVVSTWVIADDSFDVLLAEVLSRKADAIETVINDRDAAQAVSDVQFRGTAIEDAVRGWLDASMGAT